MIGTIASPDNQNLYLEEDASSPLVYVSAKDGGEVLSLNGLRLKKLPPGGRFLGFTKKAILYSAHLTADPASASQIYAVPRSGGQEEKVGAPADEIVVQHEELKMITRVLFRSKRDVFLFTP